MMTDDMKFHKIDDAIQRLAVVSGDLSKMMAVHEQRLSVQEKTLENMAVATERRRDQVDLAISQIHEETKKEITKTREELISHQLVQTKKIDGVQQIIWVAMGGATVIGFVISFLLNKISIAFQYTN